MGPTDPIELRKGGHSNSKRCLCRKRKKKMGKAGGTIKSTSHRNLHNHADGKIGALKKSGVGHSCSGKARGGKCTARGNLTQKEMKNDRPNSQGRERGGKKK